MVHADFIGSEISCQQKIFSQLFFFFLNVADQLLMASKNKNKSVFLKKTSCSIFSQHPYG